ncbi:cell envelope integrity TolA C-terminal domain-containing protein [Proteus terrae]|uniref:cell envelope integrity TolA C-terminal domain-containing protein n=1 Tax=Proteus terrae TaxID=1574161 RepID=UPI0032DAC934
MKKFILLFSLFFSGSLSASSIDNSPIINFVKKTQKSVSANFHNSESYKGKECMIKVTLSNDGELFSAVVDGRNEKNDQALCDAGIEIIKETTFTAPPEDKRISNKNTFYLEFRP